jgi:long-chain acyl-CoA synthetase
MALYPEEYTFSRFEEMVGKYPHRTAIVYLGMRFSYTFLNYLIEKFATALWNMSIRPGDKVMLYIPNCPQWVIANFAINKIGAVLVPVSPIYTSFEIEYILNDSEAKAAICMDTNFGYVKDVLERTQLQHVIVTNLVDLLPWWKKVIGAMFDKIPKGATEKGANIYTFTDVLRKGGPTPPKVTIDPWKDLAYIMYTGGTTGFPKGVAGNHMGEISYIRDIMDDVVDGHTTEGKDVVIMINPLFHIMAKGFMIAFGFNFGNTVILMPTPEVDPVLAAIERYRVRWMLGVPALYRMILENDRVDQYDLGSLAYCYCGGDTLPAEVYKTWHQKYGVHLFQVYGSTEIGHVTYSPLNKVPAPTTVGKPLKSRRVMVADTETLEPVPQGETGELLVTSDYIIKSYWKKPEETEYCFVPIGDEIYYRMGDFVRMTEDGEIEFVERTADIIKYKAYRVSASEIEAVLQDHPTVIGACVVGIADPKVGERIKAIVVLKEDAKGVSSADLLRWARDRLAPYKVPQYIEFRDMLPKSKVGKLLRREIRDEEKRKQQKDKKKSA